MKLVYRYLSVLFFVIISSNFSYGCDGVKSSLSEAVDNFAKHHKLQLVYDVSQNGKAILNGAHGFYDFANNRRLSVSDEMPLASGTKPFTAAAILILKDRGLLNLKSPISKYLDKQSGMWADGKMPKWADKVTIHNLLTHSSGIPEYVYSFKLDYNKSQLETNKDILSFLSAKELEFKPGSKFSYNNSGYAILGMIVEKVSGKKFADFMHEELFVPNGMKNTRIAGFDEAIKVQLGKSNILPARYYVIPNGTAEPKYQKVGSEIVVAPNGDGGSVSTVSDLIKWNYALHGGKILSKKSYQQMTHKYFNAPARAGYTGHVGYGLYISKSRNGTEFYHHEGSALGIRSDNGYVPSKGVAYAIISNTMLYVPKEMESKIDFTKNENQVDILYFRNTLLESL